MFAKIQNKVRKISARFVSDERGLEAIEWVGLGVVLLGLAVVAYTIVGNAVQGLGIQFAGLF